jgi:hypothetical protein
MADMTRTDTSDKIELPKLTPRRNMALQRTNRRTVQQAFLAAYERTGSIRQAAIDVEIERVGHYRWLESDSEYAAMWEAAQEGFVQNLEAHAAIRATVGQERGVWYQGQRVGSEQWVSDNLLMFLLKGRRPDIYRDRTEISGPGGGPIQLQALRPDALGRLTEAQLEALAALNGRSLAPAPADVEASAEAVDGQVEPPEDGESG